MKKLRKHIYVALLSTAVSASISLQAANTYYVATDGNDLNSGTSILSPLRTIQEAFDRVEEGDTVLIRQGTYRESAVVQPGHVGTSTNWITVQPYNSETVVIKASSIATGWQPVSVDSTNFIWRVFWPQNTQQVFVHTNENFHINDDGLLLTQIAAPSAALDGINGDGTTNFTYSVGVGDIGNNYSAYFLPHAIPLAANSATATDGVEVTNSFNGSGNLEGAFYHIRLNAATNYMSTNANVFFYDLEQTNLYISLPDSTNPDFKGIEVSDRYAPLTGNVGSTPTYFYFKDLKLRHGNALSIGSQAGSGVGNYAIYDNCDFQWSDWVGLSINENSIATNCILMNNANVGGQGGFNSLFTGCIIANNNYRDYSHNQGCGGIKCWGGRHRPVGWLLSCIS